MEWILPLKIKRKGYLKLPHTIIELPKLKITLEKFSDKDKLYLLPIQAIEKIKDNYKITPIETKSNYHLNHWFKYAHYNLCYKIYYKPEKNKINDWYILQFKTLMDSINLLVIEHGA